MIRFEWEGLIEDFLSVADEQWGLSQNQMSEETGLSPATMSRLLQGQTASIDTAAKLCAYLNKKLDDYIVDTQPGNGEHSIRDVFALLEANGDAEVMKQRGSIGYLEFYGSGDRFRVQVHRIRRGKLEE